MSDWSPIETRVCRGELHLGACVLSIVWASFAGPAPASAQPRSSPELRIPAHAPAASSSVSTSALPSSALRVRVATPLWARACLSASAIDKSYRERAEHGSARVIVAIEPAAIASRDELTLELRAGAATRRRILIAKPRDCAALPGAVAHVLLMLATADDDRPVRPAARRPFPIDETPRWQLALGVGFGARLELLPSAAQTLQLLAELQHLRGVALALRSEYSPAQHRNVAEGQVTFAAYGLSLDICAGGDADVSAGGLRVRGCGGLSVGVLRAAGRRFDHENHHRTEFSLDMGSRIQASLALSRSTRLRLEPALGVALIRPRFALRLADGGGSRTVHEPGLLHPGVSLSLMHFL